MISLEHNKLPFILSGVCSPSEANYFSNPFEVFCWYSFSRNFFRMPERVQEAMQMQVEAERKKRAAILESEGTFFL